MCAGGQCESIADNVQCIRLRDDIQLTLKVLHGTVNCPLKPFPVCHLQSTTPYTTYSQHCIHIHTHTLHTPSVNMRISVVNNLQNHSEALGTFKHHFQNDGNFSHVNEHFGSKTDCRRSPDPFTLMLSLVSNPITPIK